MPWGLSSLLLAWKSSDLLLQPLTGQEPTSGITVTGSLLSLWTSCVSYDVSSAHESKILFYIPYSNFARGRKDRRCCFQKDHSSRGRPIYKTTLVTDVHYYNRTLSNLNYSQRWSSSTFGSLFLPLSEFLSQCSGGSGIWPWTGFWRRGFCYFWGFMSPLAAQHLHVKVGMWSGGSAQETRSLNW